jgi:membrane-bound lytic murein transglycosylase D
MTNPQSPNGKKQDIKKYPGDVPGLNEESTPIEPTIRPQKSLENIVAKRSLGVFILAIGLILMWVPWSSAAYYTFPLSMDICGEPVPLSDRMVWERMDREFMINVYDRGQVYLWLKRSNRFFPYIENKLQEKGLPEDLKYLLVAESSLRAQALSNKGAAGFWQFIEKTGKRFSLQKKAWIDERLDLAKSTEAALNYLQFLYLQFGQWTLAMAAYNCGEDRIKEEIARQGENNYYRLALPKETERYIFRILTAKVLIADPKKYGFELPEKDIYLPIETEQVTLQLPNPASIRDIAKAWGSYYRELKELNPEIQGDTLPAGIYQLKIPSGKKALLKKN